MRRDLLLLVAIGAMAALGAVLVLAPGLTRQGFSLLLHGDAGHIDAFPPEAVAYVTLAHGVLGAVLIGWAVALAALVRGRWQVQPEAARAIIARSVGLWFVVDSAYSASVGAWPNVALNAGFVALFAIGLWLARDDQRGPG